MRWHSYKSEREISVLIGKTLTEFEHRKDIEMILLTCSDGTTYEFAHDQNCCESVDVEDICGDITDIIGSPITLAEESTNDQSHPVDAKARQYEPDSFTWTFYRIGTAKGMVTIRWYGESNGYYSESVSLYETTPTTG